MASCKVFQKQNKETEAEQATYRARTLVGHARKGSGRRGPEEEPATPRWWTPPHWATPPMSPTAGLRSRPPTRASVLLGMHRPHPTTLARSTPPVAPACDTQMCRWWWRKSTARTQRTQRLTGCTCKKQIRSESLCYIDHGCLAESSVFLQGWQYL